MATSYAGLLVIKRAFLHPATLHSLNHSTQQNTGIYNSKHALIFYACISCPQTNIYSSVHAALWRISATKCRTRCTPAVYLFVCVVETLPVSSLFNLSLLARAPKHSETITSRLVKMDHTFVLFSADFFGAVKVFISVQTRASASKVSFSRTCRPWWCVLSQACRCLVTCRQWLRSQPPTEEDEELFLASGLQRTNDKWWRH